MEGGFATAFTLLALAGVFAFFEGASLAGFVKLVAAVCGVVVLVAATVVVVTYATATVGA